MAAGNPHDFRGYPGSFLQESCGITAIKASDLDDLTHMHTASLGLWSRGIASQGGTISQAPIQRGTRIVGIQFRAFWGEE
jgi:hypothetical protein